MNTEFHPCAVCQILDGDNMIKECSYCDFCKSWICAADQYSPRRVQAWAEKTNINISQFIKKYTARRSPK